MNSWRRMANNKPQAHTISCPNSCSRCFYFADSQKSKNVTGKALPKNATSGQISWIEETPKSIIGRAEEVNDAVGTTRSFSCGYLWERLRGADLPPEKGETSVSRRGSP